MSLTGRSLFPTGLLFWRIGGPGLALHPFPWLASAGFGKLWLASRLSIGFPLDLASAGFQLDLGFHLLGFSLDFG